MSNADTQNTGSVIFISEVKRRGGTAVKTPGSGTKALFDVTGSDGHIYRIEMKTRNAVKGGDWIASKKDGYPAANPGVDAWALVSSGGDVAQSRIVPAGHMRSDIAERTAQWLAADPSRSVEANDHYAIRPDHVAEWSSRWDIIGLGDKALSTPESEEVPAVEEILTVSPAGAGFGDPESNRLVEAAAVQEVTDYLESRGYDVMDVGSKNLGWDLTCVGEDGDIRRVEVKGVSGATPTVLLTANEYRSARETDGWELAVVTTALASPSLTFYSAGDAVAAAAPMVYRVTL